MLACNSQFHLKGDFVTVCSLDCLGCKHVWLVSYLRSDRGQLCTMGQLLCSTAGVIINRYYKASLPETCWWYINKLGTQHYSLKYLSACLKQPRLYKWLYRFSRIIAGVTAWERDLLSLALILLLTLLLCCYSSNLLLCYCY